MVPNDAQGCLMVLNGAQWCPVVPNGAHSVTAGAQMFDGEIDR